MNLVTGPVDRSVRVYEQPLLLACSAAWRATVAKSVTGVIAGREDRQIAPGIHFGSVYAVFVRFAPRDGIHEGDTFAGLKLMLRHRFRRRSFKCGYRGTGHRPVLDQVGRIYKYVVERPLDYDTDAGHAEELSVTDLVPVGNLYAVAAQRYGLHDLDGLASILVGLEILYGLLPLTDNLETSLSRIVHSGAPLAM